MCYRNNTIFLTLAFVFSGQILAADNPAFETSNSNESIEAVFGRSEQLDIKLEQASPSSHIVIGGGGPYLDKEIKLDANVIALAQQDQLSFAATNDKRIVSIIWNDPTPEKTSQKAPRVLQSIKVSAPILQMKVAGKLLFTANAKSEIVVYNIENEGITEVGRHPFDVAISDFSVDAKSLVVLLAQNTIHSLRYQQNSSLAVTFNNGKELQLEHAANSISHHNNYLFVAGPALGLSLFSLTDPSTIKLLDHVYSAGQALNMVYRDDILYIADGDKGASMYRIGQNQHIQWLGSHSKLGRVSQIWPYADKIFIRNEHLRVAELNFDDPSLPITGDIYKPNSPIDVAAAAKGYLYITSAAHIKRIDFRHRGATQISNEGINLGGSRRAFVENHIAYVADWFSGLHIYDMRIPQQPRHLGNYHTPGSSKGVVVKDHIAYVADDDHGLQIIDVNDPSSPKLISHINSTGLAYTLKYHRRKIYLADHRGGFHIIDVSNPKKPREITHYDTPGKAWAIAAKKNYVFVADDQSGLLVFDIRNAAQPKEIGQYKPGGYAEDLEIHGNIAYVSFFDQGLHIVDISNPRKPRRIAALAIPGNARSIRVRNQLAYIAGWESGLQIVDVTASKQPRLVANLDTSGSTWGVDVEGNYAYLWDWWGGVKVADISDPRHPHLIGQYQNSENIQALTIENNHAFVAQGGNGLQVFDVTNPANPIWMTGINLPGMATSLTSSPDHVFIALGSAGFAVVDSKNPFQLQLLSMVEVDGSIRKILYHNNALYVARDSGDILLFDVQKAKAPKLRQRFDANINDWAVFDKSLIFSSDSGIQALSLTQKTSLHYLPATKFDCLSIVGKVIAACDEHGNIHLLHLYADRFEQQSLIQHKGTWRSLQIHDQVLYGNSDSDGVWQYDISDIKNPRPTAHYRATGSDKNMAWHKETLLFSGSKTLNSLPLLPALHTSTGDDGKLKLQVPAGLGMGYYHLWLENDDGTQWFYPNRLHVGLKRARKPAMTMEKFKELMKQQLQQSNPPTRPEK